MDDNKEKKFWQSWMTIAVLSGLTIMVLLFNSQSPSIRSEENISIVNTNIINNDTNITANDINIINNDTNITDNDTYFKNTVGVNLGVIADNLKCIAEAGKNRNFNATERCGKFLSENSNNSLKHISEYSVSPSLQVALDEYRKGLEYYNIGGTNLEMGARNRDALQMSNAIEYIQNGTTYLNTVANILYENKTSNAASNAAFIHPRANKS